MDEELKVSLTNLGDVTGCTIVANCPGMIPNHYAKRLKDILEEAIPEAAHILVLCDGIEISVDRDSDDEREGANENIEGDEPT